MAEKDNFDIECVSEVLSKYEGKHPVATIKQFESCQIILEYLPAEYAESLGVNLSMSFKEKLNFDNERKALLLMLEHFSENDQTAQSVNKFV